MARDRDGFLSDVKLLEEIEHKFLLQVHPYLCDFSAPTIADIVGYCAVASVWTEYIKVNHDKYPKTYRWMSKMSENEEVTQIIQQLKPAKAKL